jgi:hypothetical protein
MNKTAALNKLAGAVTEYIKAEQNYSKIAQVSQNYVMQKQADMRSSLMQLFGRQASPKPAESHMLRNLLLGGGALGAGALGYKHYKDQQTGGSDPLATLANIVGHTASSAQQLYPEAASMFGRGLASAGQGLADEYGPGINDNISRVEKIVNLLKGVTTSAGESLSAGLADPTLKNLASGAAGRR